MALMSGGVNHIDTGHTYRFHRAEKLVGNVLRTLIEKHGYSRNEFYINSK